MTEHVVTQVRSIGLSVIHQTPAFVCNNDVNKRLYTIFMCAYSAVQMLCHLGIHSIACVYLNVNRENKHSKKQGSFFNLVTV